MLSITKDHKITQSDIILTKAGAREKVIIRDHKHLTTSITPTEAVRLLIKLKKWGWNKPNYKIIDTNKIMVSDWAIPQIIGKKGAIIKHIQYLFGNVSIIKLPYEEDDMMHYGKLYDIKKKKITNDNPKWYRLEVVKPLIRAYIDIDDNSLYYDNEYKIISE